MSQAAVRTISASEHLAFIERQGSASFLQTPAWAQVKSDMTGSRVGDGALYLLVGSGDGTNGPLDQNSIIPGSAPHHVAVAGWGVFHGSTFTDGSIAYQQFHASDNPYDPRFLKGWTGTATVGPLTPISTGDAASPKQPDNNDHDL